MPDRSSRFMTALATVVVLGGAGAACWFGAQAAAIVIEDRSRDDVRLALQTAGFDWVAVATDGLQVRLSGTAPSEADRFRAMTRAAAAVESSRIIDSMSVARREALNPPQFEVELLRNDAGISLIGLVPSSTDRVSLVRLLESETAALGVTDLLEAADYPVPAGWQAALDYGMRAAQMTRRAKISIAPGQVSVTAITDSPAEKARLQTELTRARPESVVLATEISAPRPVIAPFTLRFVTDEDGPRFDACAADTEASHDAIVQAGVRAGVSGRPGCTIGLGSPSPDWGRAAVAAINAVAALGRGTVTIADADVALIAPADVPAERFDEVSDRLKRALPAVFSLQSQHEQAERPDRGPAEFAARISTDGTLTMRGRITDDRMNDAVNSIAQARFKSVESNLRNDPEVPGGWTVRVIAGLEAMAPLNSGSLSVAPDLVQITGTSGDPQASAKSAAALAERLGAGARYELAIRYDRRLDPTLGLPDGQQCVDALNLTMSESAIGFEPNRSVIAGDAGPTIAALAETMQNCGEFQIELAGHTDAQGSEGFNADLSRSRAQAVLAAMANAGAPAEHLTVRGYGESQPIASNDTEEGREANRRIEFRLLSELPVRTEPLPEPAVVRGVTGDIANTGEGAAAGTTGAITTAAVRAGAVAMPGTRSDAAQPGFQGPPMPDFAPSIVGVTESLAESGIQSGAESGTAFPTEDETARLPVQTPDDDTPRPQPRPGEIAGTDGGDTASEAPAE